MGKLTRNQQVFCDEYLIDLNATRAYKVAYKRCKKDNTARSNSSKLLTNTNIKSYIDEKMKAREKRTEITQDRVLKELSKIGFANATDYVNIIEGEYEEDIIEDGVVVDKIIKTYKYVELQDTEKLTEDKRVAISEIKQGKNGIELKLHDKVRTLELMGRHLGMFTDKVELSGNMDINNPIKDLTTEELRKLIDK